MRGFARRMALCGPFLAGGLPGSVAVAQQDPPTLDIPQIAVPRGEAGIAIDQPTPDAPVLTIEQPSERTYDRCASADAATTPGCDPQVVLIPDLLLPEGNPSLQPGGAYIRLGDARDTTDGGQDIGAIVVTTRPPPSVSIPPDIPEGASSVVIESTVPVVIRSDR